MSDGLSYTEANEKCGRPMVDCTLQGQVACAHLNIDINKLRTGRHLFASRNEWDRGCNSRIGVNHADIGGGTVGRRKMYFDEGRQSGKASESRGQSSDRGGTGESDECKMIRLERSGVQIENRG